MLLISTVAVILGQKWGIPGVAACSVFLAFAQRGGAYFIGARWQDAIALLVLLVCLAAGSTRLLRERFDRNGILP
jgi:branched-subunit amino acid ABC-type transport system permease component